jgi:hypothetical protein
MTWPLILKKFPSGIGRRMNSIIATKIIKRTLRQALPGRRSRNVCSARYEAAQCPLGRRDLRSRSQKFEVSSAIDFAPMPKSQQVDCVLLWLKSVNDSIVSDSQSVTL